MIQNEDFEPFDLKNDYDQIEKFKENLNGFGKALSNIIVILRRSSVLIHKQDNFIHSNLDEYLNGGTVKYVNFYPTHTKKDEYKEGELSEKSQFHSMILHLLYGFRDFEGGAVPLPTQILLCSTNMTRSQID